MNVYAIYEGSDGNATKVLYEQLEKLGPMGLVALNLFRAQKCSTRAKVYRGRGNRQDAYERKQWSMENLARVLMVHGKALEIRWGWKRDLLAAGPHQWVLYVDLPGPYEGRGGQVSFHTAHRGEGPEYPAEWDGQRDAVAGRVVAFVQRVITARDSRV